MTTRNEMTVRSQLLSACCPPSDNAEHHELRPEQISLFKVPLRCEAATGLGCGVKAKPILQALAHQPAGAPAGLNRGGTVVSGLWGQGVVCVLRRGNVRLILAVGGACPRGTPGAAPGGGAW